MSDRNQAISILRHARHVLIDRLTNRVLDAGDEILRDAEGYTYTSELEAVYDEIGARLANVSGLLSNLPPEPAAKESDEARPVEEESSAPVAAADVESSSEDRQPADAASLRLFAGQVAADNLEAATATLADLLDVDLARARRCAETFRARLTTQPDILQKAVQLRALLRAGQVDASLSLLRKCFGLKGPESIGALHALQTRQG